MAKLTDTQFLALTTLKREPHAVISVSSERALIRLGLIHPTRSTITLKGQVTLRRSGDVPSVKEWEIVTIALQENEAEKCCGAVDPSDLDACGQCEDCKPEKVPGALADPELCGQKLLSLPNGRVCHCNKPKGHDKVHMFV